ncbi:tigger transposable element-derived protein 6-like [Montipora capricornis]|uniref:tigger transposable element-derived protein 6-like n=1 Tax=Montipora capricornis TaxID=246305 RepID=UPI0035F136E7
MSASWEQTTLPTILSSYNLADIYNADEFGLFSQALSEKSLHVKSEKCVGGKHSKNLVDGNRCDECPRRKTSYVCDCKGYTKLASGEMIEEVLTTYLFANQVRNSCLQRQPSVWIAKPSEMFASSHRDLASPCSGNHKNVYNGTSLSLRMMHNSVFTIVLAILVGRCVDIRSRSATDALKMCWFRMGWDKVTPGTINNCFRAAGISHQSQESALSDGDDPFKTLAEEINNLRERAPELAPKNVIGGIVVECDDAAAASF